MTGFDALTTSQFQDALARRIDESKPDPLSKGQLEKLRLSWAQHDGADDDDLPRKLQSDENPLRSLSRGTLTLSSEYISIAICATSRYRCKIKMTDEEGDCPRTFDETSADDAVGDTSFENEFYIQLTVSANLVSYISTNEEKIDRKERAAKRKSHTGMIKRLRSDRSISRLLIDEKGISSDEIIDTTGKEGLHQKGGLPLCEALIQQNQSKPRTKNNSKDSDCVVGAVTGNSHTHGALEERVNVDEDSLEGIRNAIFSHCDGNLDVLEILLNLPYFPRSPSESLNNPNTPLCTLAERAYLRLLEDAMFDACEKEGEDELLDDLNISGENNRCDEHGSAATEDDDVATGKKWQTKRVKPSQAL